MATMKILTLMIIAVLLTFRNSFSNAVRNITPILDITIFMDIERNPGPLVDIEGKEK